MTQLTEQIETPTVYFSVLGQRNNMSRSESNLHELHRNVEGARLSNKRILGLPDTELAKMSLATGVGAPHRLLV